MPPSAPERRRAAVLGGAFCVEAFSVEAWWFCGMWRKARRGPVRSSWTLKVMGLMMHCWLLDGVRGLVVGKWVGLLVCSSERLDLDACGVHDSVAELVETSMVIG